jgi:uncharacterized protein
MKNNIIDFNETSGLSGKALEELESFLLFESGLKQPMNLETLDGFLTALIVGPDTLLPSFWLPFVWDSSGDGQSPAFHTEQQATRIIGIIMQLMNSIVYSLDEFTDEYEPLPDMMEYETDAERRRGSRLWCIGFLMGISIKASSWDALLKDKKASYSTTLISMAGGMLRDELQIGEEKEFEVWESVPEAVLDIRAFWMPYRERAIDRLRSASAATPGRNDECPCGSGRKYKKCCGK